MSQDETEDSAPPPGVSAWDETSGDTHEDEQTVVSRRSSAQKPDAPAETDSTRGSGTDPAPDSDDADDTRAVSRPQAHGAHPGDHTLIVSRSHPARLVPPAPQEEDDATRAIDRRPSLVEERIAGRRRGISPPPLPPGLAEKVMPAVEAVGPGTVERYAPRDLPPAPAARPLSQPATGGRPGSSSLSSVTRKGRRHARAALAAWAVISALSLAGLVTLALQLL